MNIDDFLFLTCMILYVYTIGIPPFFDNIIIKMHYLLFESLKNLNEVMHADYWLEDYDIETNNSNKNESTDTQIQDNIIQSKYEDKYLEDIRLMNKEWVFTEKEIENKISLKNEFFEISIKDFKNRICEINEKILNLETDIADDSDTVNYFDETEQNDYESTLEERNEWRREEIANLKNELEEINTAMLTENGINDLNINAEKMAENYIINKRIEKLKDTFVMEKTPQGNVLMIYNKEKGSFSYYSDATIPYRYLEVVSRKYVKFFGCRPLFVDMEEELKLFEEKWTTEYEMKKAKEAEEKLKAEEAEKNNKPLETKKNVFAKFKSYNKDAGGKISMAPPPKNSIPSKSATETKEDEKVILKERANRYTYEGKFANFNFLQKIEKKVFNKRLGLTFADFKKTQKNN
jgi:hypothetical protein